MQNFNILVETDELVTVPHAAKKLKHHFTTVYRWIKKVKVFSFPIHRIYYLHIIEAQALS